MLETIIDTLECGCSIVLKENGHFRLDLCEKDAAIVMSMYCDVFSDHDIHIYECGCSVEISGENKAFRPCQKHLRTIREFQLNLGGVFAAIRRAQAAYSEGAESIHIPGSALRRLRREVVLTMTQRN